MRWLQIPPNRSAPSRSARGGRATCARECRYLRTRAARPFGWLALVVVLVPGYAFGHNPVTSWSVARLQSDRLELTLEMAAESAWLFLGERAKKPDIRNAIARLEAQGPSAFQLGAHGQTLVPRSVAIELDEEDGVMLRLIYMRPPAGPLSVEANFLRRLPPDHMTTVTLIGDDGAAGEPILLTLEQPSTRIPLPAPAKASDARQAASTSGARHERS